MQQSFQSMSVVEGYNSYCLFPRHASTTRDNKPGGTEKKAARQHQEQAQRQQRDQVQHVSILKIRRIAKMADNTTGQKKTEDVVWRVDAYVATSMCTWLVPCRAPLETMSRCLPHGPTI